MEDGHHLAMLHRARDPGEHELAFFVICRARHSIEGHGGERLEIVVDQELDDVEGGAVAGLQIHAGTRPAVLALDAPGDIRGDAHRLVSSIDFTREAPLVDAVIDPPGAGGRRLGDFQAEDQIAG
jgi:hypothetical protein